jgi:ABC-2 type transport system permease protein
MSLRKILATMRRVLRQLSHDHRSMAMIILIPVILLTLLKYVFNDKPQMFNGVAPLLLGIFPLFMMFLVTSITTLRERRSGTLDRLMTYPMAKLDLVFGYALAFSIVGFVQALVTTGLTLGLLDVVIMGGTLPILITAVLAAFLGTSLGLFVSAFARNEFQAVQLVMPILMPQVLLCGLFVARDQMARPLELLSDVFPLTYSVDAMRQAAMNPTWTGDLTRNMLIVLGCGIAALILGSITIRRQET